MPAKKVSIRRSCIPVLLLSGLPALPANAGPHGFDLHNTLMPASGGMAGTSLATPLDVPSALYGNPATLSQFRGTQAAFGATLYKPRVEINHDGSVTGAAFDAESNTQAFPVPNIAITQDLRGGGIPGTLGIGFSAISGIGAEFKNEPKSLGAGAEFTVFGVNAGGGFELADGLSLGGALTVSFAQLDAGLASSGAEVHDLGYRGSLGLTYDLPAHTTTALYYQTELSHTFKNAFQTDSTSGGFPSYSSQTVEQPANLGFGLSNRSLLDGRLLLALDVIHKSWEQSKFWGDVYNDQTVGSLGAQLSSGDWRFRLGYGYAEDPNKDSPESLGGLDQVQAGVGGKVIPLSTPVIQYLQATQTVVIYEHRATVGLGYKDLVMEGLDGDIHFGWQFENDRDFGGHTKARVSSWQLGFGLTWRM
ncbi:OmpP1/FadL family transporter [Thiohalorhabdus sp. Cl-TMA]|uniref:OmpP1/FadL family transporter n=1 Tax=Thiohalorhabdus methylotrophus TaxID=3242694 RepID=A0ABV4TSD3_9GAMM